MDTFRVAIAVALVVVTMLTIIHVNAVVGIVMLTGSAIVVWLGHMLDNVKRSSW